jgi:hypothetical protein
MSKFDQALNLIRRKGRPVFEYLFDALAHVEAVDDGVQA